MTTSHGRRIQSRRALAIMAWVSLVIIAGLLWYGQEEDTIRIQAWEPAALLLSAYSAFLAIFGWLLFAPERKSAEESPALFFSGMLTLIPPCFIAYHLMPPSSPLRGWLTLGVFVFGLFAILSPLPAEVFAVPRDRKSYLQPLTDSYLSVIDVEERQLDLQSVVPRFYHSLTTPDVARSPTTPRSTARDPWTDPFYGTGRAMSQVGFARRSTYSESPDRTHENDHDRPLPQFREPRRPSGLGYPATRTSVPPVSPMPSAIPSGPANPTNPVLSRPPMIAPSAFATHESRSPNYHPQFTAPVTSTPETGIPGLVQPSPMLASTTAPRRPLTEPVARTSHPVGFQTPQASRHIVSSAPPVPSYPASATARVSTPVPPPVTRDLPTRTTPPVSDPSVKPGSSGAQPLIAQPLIGLPSRAAETDLRELDRRIREMEVDDDHDADLSDDAVVQSAMSPTRETTPLSDVKMERLKDELGGEMIDGTIRVFFEVGQKRAHLHVPISPPLAGLPEVECEAVSDDSVRCKVAVRQPYGIRIEARRSDASQALDTDIGFAAVYTPSARRG